MLLQAHSSPLPSSPPPPYPGDAAPAPDAPRPKLTLLASVPCAVPSVLRELIGKRPGKGGVVVVVDADATRREASARRLWRFLSGHGVRGWVVVATADARRALPGSSVVLALPAGGSRSAVTPLRKTTAAPPSIASPASGSRLRAQPRGTKATFPSQLRRTCAELCPGAVLLVDAGRAPRRSA